MRSLDKNPARKTPMEKSGDTGPGPSEEELRRVVTSNVTPKFSSVTPTEQMDRQAEAERAKKARSLREQITFARSLGVRVGNFEVPDENDPEFEGKRGFIEGRVRHSMAIHYKEFGRNLANDPDMKTLIARYRTAQDGERRAGVAPNLDALSDARSGLSGTGLLDKVRPFFGGETKSERADKARKNRENIGGQIVALMCRRFEDAGLNKIGPERFNAALIVTPKTSTLSVAEEVMGLSLL